MRRKASKGLLALALALLAACFAAALLLAGGSAGHGQTRQGPLTIGALFSLTGTGSLYGPQQLRGARLAVAEVNAAGGVNGAPLRLSAIDDRSDPAHGTAAMRTLIEQQGVLAVLGPTLSLVAAYADPLANRLRTPVLAVSNTADGIVGRCRYPCEWIWRNSLGESVAVPANIVQFVLAHHPPSAVVMYTTRDPLAQSEAAHALRTFRSRNVQVRATIRVPRSGSLRTAVAKVLALKPSVLFIGTSFAPGTAIKAMRLLRAGGYTGAILGGNTFNSATVVKLAGRFGKRAQSGAAWYYGNSFPANAEFLAAYKQAYSAAPDQFAAQAYAGVQILVSALRRAGVARSTAPVAEQRAQIQNALGNTALMTPLGPFRFNSSHDVEQIVWVQAMNGRGGHELVGFCNPGC